MKWKIVLVAVIAFAFLHVPQVYAVLECQIYASTTDCTQFGWTPIIGLYGTENTHAALVSETGYSHHLCCHDTDPSITIGNACSGYYYNFLNLAYPTNSHAEISSYTTYPEHVCLSASGSEVEGVQCVYRAVDCVGDEARLLSIYQATNSHVANFDYYSIKICCEIELEPVPVDTTPPTVTINGPSGWTNDNTPTYTGTATDTQSNIQIVRIYDDMILFPAIPVDGAWDERSEAYTYTMNPLSEGNHYMYALAYDVPGNSGISDTIITRIDITSPVTAINLNPSAWTTSDVSYSVSCSDLGSGCRYIFYKILDLVANPSATCSDMSGYSRVDASSPPSGSISCPAGTTCRRMICAYSHDYAGNNGVFAGALVRIDRESPVTTIVPDGTGWQGTDISYYLYPDDGGGSGIERISYRVIDEGQLCSSAPAQLYVPTDDPPSYLGSVTCPNGQTCRKQVCFYSRDNVGNVESEKASQPFLMDKEPPDGSITINDGDAYTSTVDVTLSMTFMDRGIGVRDCRYRNDGEAWADNWEACTNSKPFWSLRDEEGDRYVFYQIRDDLGNIAGLNDELNDSIRYDKTPPDAPEVTDDGDCTTSTTTLHARWNPISGSVRYEYAIGTAQWPTLGWNSVKGLTNVGLNTEFTDNTLSLTEWSEYYITVRAVDAGGLDAFGSSDGILINPCCAMNCGFACTNASGFAGICDGNDFCYGGPFSTGSACTLTCGTPATPAGDERYCFDLNAPIDCGELETHCGRSGSFKSGSVSVCDNNEMSCAEDPASVPLSGSFEYSIVPSGTFGLGDAVTIEIDNVVINQPNEPIFECMITDPDGRNIYLNQWDDSGGTVRFTYVISSGDPGEMWTLDYCGIYSDFRQNDGWQIYKDETNYNFFVDMTPPTLTIDYPPSDGVWFNSDFDVRATATDSDGINLVQYWWESGGSNVTMPNAGGNVYREAFDVSSAGDGSYTLFVWAEDNSGNAVTASRTFGIDTVPPAFGSYSISNCIATDTSGSLDICWVGDGTATTHTLINSDPLSGIEQETLKFDGTPVISSRRMSDGSFIDVDIDDDVLDIQSWSGNDWDVVAGTDPVDHDVKFSAVDVAGNVLPETDAGWVIRSDENPPTSSVDPLPEYWTNIYIDLTWSGNDPETGIDCYTIEYRYKVSAGAPFNSWDTIDFGGTTCTTESTAEFDALAHVPAASLPSQINGYVFQFRSLARDRAGNVEVKANEDTETTLQITRLLNLRAEYIDTGMIILPGKKVPKGREIRLVGESHAGDLQEINITYYEHVPGTSPGAPADTTTCSSTDYCEIVLPVYDEQIQVSYFAMANDGLEVERVPLNGLWNLVYVDHPISNFVVRDVLHLILGLPETVGVEVRNIQPVSDTITLTLSERATFVETGTDTMVVDLSSQEERTVYARIIPADLNNFQLTLTGSSPLYIEDDTHTIQVVVSLPADFPSASYIGIMLLITISTIIFYVRSRKLSRQS